ncbi:MAG TPA: aminotransferase class V-fold PLP-dependent enzyme [Bryobacteraceae bacterium]|nr:aminotransferase class V-fold PLP-dependent enzyme [Bryobacteraceae bacterium]
MGLTGGYVFPQAEAVAYLDTAAEGLPFPGCEEALACYCRDKSLGTPGRARMQETEDEARALAASLLGAEPQNVALVASASEGLNLLANSLPWQSGDEVVLTDLEFPSNVLAWLRLRDRGVHLRLVETKRGTVSPAEFAQAITPHTRMVTVSQVSYKSGTQIRFLPALAELAHRVGACLCVDATQALGRVPVSVDGVNYLVASSYKWLLAHHGVAVVYISPALRDRLAPGAVGWYSVHDIFTPDRFTRFELRPGAEALVCGMPNFPSIYSLRASLRYLLEIGPARIDAALAPLVRKLREGLCALGLELLTPAAPEFASGIVSFEHPASEEIGAALAAQGVVVWAGDGRVRASVHLYNRESDIDRYLTVLASILESRRA